MKIFLIRHGEMSGNPFIEPRRPVSGCLSERGIRQAERVRDYFRSRAIDTAYSSTFGRALQTAEIALDGKETPIRILPGIHEWMPDLTLKQLPSTEYEAIIKRNAELMPDEEWKTPLGEGCFDMYARIVPAFLAALKEQGIRPGCGGYLAEKGSEERSLAFFAHGGSLGVLLSFLMGMPPFPQSSFSFEQGGVCEVVFLRRKDVYYPVLPFHTPGGEK